MEALYISGNTDNFYWTLRCVLLFDFAPFWVKAAKPCALRTAQKQYCTAHGFFWRCNVVELGFRGLGPGVEKMQGLGTAR